MLPPANQTRFDYKILIRFLDPVTERRLKRATNIKSTGTTFDKVAEEWLEKRKKDWSAGHHKRVKEAFDRDVNPKIGKLPIDRIDTPMLTSIVEKIAKRGVHETARRILTNISRVFKLGIAKGYCQHNPAAAVQEVIPTKKSSTRFPGARTWPQIEDVLRLIATSSSKPNMRLCARLQAFTCVRIANAVQAEWKEFDLDADMPLWTIPRAKLKRKDSDAPDLRIALHPTITEELRNWKKLSDGRTKYVFPTESKSGHLTSEAVEKFYRVTLDLAGKHCPHGWRTSLSSTANDSKMFDSDVIEIALDHLHDDNEVVLAYDRGERFAQRVQLLQWWGNQLVLSLENALK